MNIPGLSELHQTLKTSDETQATTFQLEVPVDGSLALLALGDIGLLAWRAAKNHFIQVQKEFNKSGLNQKNGY